MAKYKLSDKNSAEYDCPDCGKPAIFFKFLYRGSAGNEYAVDYRFRCSHCGSKRAVARERKYYELLKDLDWVKSSGYIKYLSLKEQQSLLD